MAAGGEQTIKKFVYDHKTLLETLSWRVSLVIIPGLEPFLAVAHMTLAAPKRWSWPALLSHQTQDVCVNMERLHAEASWALLIRADVFVPLCRRLALLKLHFSFNVDTLMSTHSDSRRFLQRECGLVPSCQIIPPLKRRFHVALSAADPEVDLQELIYNVLLKH